MLKDSQQQYLTWSFVVEEEREHNEKVNPLAVLVELKSAV